MSGQPSSTADEHPLEALYQARDAAQRASVRARHVGLVSAERATYETVLGDLLVALDELSAQYGITFPTGTTDRGTGADGEAQALAALLRSRPDQTTQTHRRDAPRPCCHGKDHAPPVQHRLSDTAE